MNTQVREAGFDVERIRKDFPILNTEVNGVPLVYFDNAATSQKPQVVIDAVSRYYSEINSNVHRGVHHLSQMATDALEGSREKIRRHLNASKAREIIFTRGTTESINLVASGMGQGLVKSGDNILISAMEHHSNIVPWQMLCERTGAELRVIPMSEKGELELNELDNLLDDRTRMVAVNHISNSLGTINPVKVIIDKAHQAGAWVLIDGAQSVPHMKVDVSALDADFYTFSGHKTFGPTGIGVLYGKEALLEELPPYQGGGEMISSVSFEKTTYAELPFKFEAGTPNIAGGIALGTAIDYINSTGLSMIKKQEADLLAYATDQLKSFGDVRIIGEAENKTSVISFLVGDLHPYDMGMILDKLGVAMRTGHHCTQPIMDQLKIPGTLRASFAFYNTRAEVDRMIEGLARAKQMLS
jgi:cysteine desulfurase/selenocysteine lyase